MTRRTDRNKAFWYHRKQKYIPYKDWPLKERIQWKICYFKLQWKRWLRKLNEWLWG